MWRKRGISVSQVCESLACRSRVPHGRKTGVCRVKSIVDSDRTDNIRLATKTIETDTTS